MKTQISRNSHHKSKRYSGVYQQQGRMLTDADWNELVNVLKEQMAQAMVDVIGDGSPRASAVSITGDRQIQPGDLYVDGARAEVPGHAKFEASEQLDFPGFQTLPSAGPYVVFADVWERSVTSLEDFELRDAGLHGADTCTRTQTMLQVKWCSEATNPEADIPQKGNALLSLDLHTSMDAGDPCDPCAGLVAAGEGRVGNYLFRVEVHEVTGSADNPDEIVLKWSSENGAEQFEAKAEDKMPPGFVSGKYVYEFFDLTSEKHLGVHLTTGFTPTTGVLKESYEIPEGASEPKEFVRRLDGYCTLERSGSNWSLKDGRDKGIELSITVASTAPGYVSLEPSLLANLEALKLSLDLTGKTFVAGDYWLAPVREKIHGPGSVIVSGVEPQGIIHHYLRLAQVKSDGTVEQFLDDADRRRHSFPPLTDIRAHDVGYETDCDSGLFDAGYDNVKKALDQICKIQAQHVGFTKPCNTSLYQGQTVSTVQDALALLCDIRADHVSFTAKPDCTLLNQPGINTVQDAIDALCLRPSGSGCAVTVGAGGQYETLQEAFTALQENRDICLCLLPGIHEIDEDLVASEKNTIKITGCGAASNIYQSSQNLSFSANQILLQDLRLNIIQTKGKVILSGEEVTAERCTFVRELTGGWEKRYRHVTGKRVAVDSNGDVLITGYFTGRVDFGGAELISAGQSDIFVVKINGADSSHVWSKSFGNTQGDRGESVAVDSNGDVFITGYFAGIVDFGGGQLGSEGGMDIFAVKLNGADSSHVWSKSFGGSGSDWGNSIAVDSSGDVIITGSFGDTVDFGGGELKSAGKSDIFVVKLNGTNGSHIWSKSFGGLGMDRGYSVAVGSSGDVIITGSFGDTVDFGGGELKSAGKSDIFVVKLNGTNGSHIWSKSFGGSGSDNAISVVVDSRGHVVITGDFTGSVDFGGGELGSEGGVFSVKLKGTDGSHIWSKIFGGSGSDWGGSIAVDSSDNVIITGQFTGTLDFGGIGHSSQPEGADIFVVTLNGTDGIYICSQGLGYMGNDLWPDVAVGMRDELFIIWNNNKNAETSGVMFTVQKHEKIPPLVRVIPKEELGSTTLHWTKNRMYSRQEALVLGKGVGGLIEDNDIEGYLTLNYTERVVPLLWSKTDAYQQERKQLWASSNEAYVPWNQIRLTLRGNNVRGVRSNGAAIMAVMDDILNHGESATVSQEGYQSIIVTGNVFRSNGNSFICHSLVMNGNQLVWPTRESDVVAFVLGYDGVFSGNTGPMEQDREVVIETILKRKAVAANLLEIV